ncbi:hypothetical protein [Brevibacillus reuszeri]|uniref:hypothetical protein n=1 Tax=Brevibacillus reuszeri TaxID=54915 RepID=UPI000CCBF74D|nr:hypothetical protein [Brevibacillus reuszeri]
MRNKTVSVLVALVIVLIAIILLNKYLNPKNEDIFIDKNSLLVEEIDNVQIYDAENKNIYTLNQSIEISSILSILESMNNLEISSIDDLTADNVNVIFQIYIKRKGYYPNSPITIFEDGTVLVGAKVVTLDSKAKAILEKALKDALKSK